MKMKKFIYALVLLLTAASFAQTYDHEYYYDNKQFAISGGRDSDPIYLAFSELYGTYNRGTGDAFYCDPNVSYEGNGKAWKDAKNTLDEAVNLCTDNQGDVIYIAEDSAFTMGAAADEVDADVHGITIIGCGEGNNMPTFNYTGDVTGAFAIGADNITIINCRFTASVADANDAVEVEAGSTNLTLIGCIFDATTEGTHEFHEAINQSGAVADNLRVIGCEFRMGAGAARSAIAFRDADYLQIYNCKFVGDYAVADINNATTASNHISIHDNEVYNGTTGGAAGLNTLPCIAMKSDTSGVIYNNKVICNVATPDAAIVAADCFLAGNVYSETEGGYDAPPSWLTTDSALNIFGYNDSDNAVSTSSVAGNVDGSMVERLEQIDVDINDIEGAIVQSDVDVNDIEEYAVAIMADSNELITDLDQVDVDINDIEEYAVAIMADSNELITDLDQVDVDINDIEEYAVAIMADSNELITDLDQVDVDINDIEEAITQLDVDANDIEEAITQLDVDVNDIEEYAVAIMADSNELITDLDQVDVDINDIEEYASDIFDDSDAIDYWQERTSTVTVAGLTNVEDHLFDVDGGPILITSLVGIVTVAIDSNVATCGIEIDRDDTAADTELTTLVNIEDDVLGTVYVFTDVAIPALTPLVPGAVGSNTLMSPWFCPEGMIEQANSAANLTGTIVWYMTWKPLTTGITVTAQ